MPAYEVVDLAGVWSWIRQPDGEYIVDKKYVEEFKKAWNDKKNQ